MFGHTHYALLFPPTAGLAVVRGHGGPALESFLLYLGNHVDCTVNKAAVRVYPSTFNFPLSTHALDTGSHSGI